jgi:hypothetical protein
MSVRSQERRERSLYPFATCTEEQISFFWGLRRPAVYADELGAIAVVVGLGGCRFIFMPVDRGVVQVVERGPV